MVHPIQRLIVPLTALVMAGPAGADAAMPATVVFVCEHGSAKSLLAASLFNRMAKERGLTATAISRGTSPDAAVPEAVVQALEADGFHVASFRPQSLTDEDVAAPARVVAIGVDLGSRGTKAGARAVRWDGVPPFSTSYADARRDLVRRIDALLEELQASARKSP